MKRTLKRSGAGAARTRARAACGAGETARERVDFEGRDDNQRVVELAVGMTLGNEDAPITIHEFGDYLCPGCGQFAALVKTQIEQSLVPDGRVKFVYYDFPLTSIHPHAFVAARASRCAADQDRYWEYHGALFQNQSVWATSSTAPLGLLEDYAGELGLDEGAFSSCLRSDRHAELVSANMTLGELLGVTGTPSVLISQGGAAQRLADNSFAGIQAAVNAILAEMAEEDGGSGAETGGA